MDKLSPRAALYLRVSTSEQGQGQSLQVQQERCHAAALARGAEVMRVLSDEFSGRTTNRPGYQELLSLMRGRQVDMVIVYKLDRAFRSAADFFDFTRLCEQTGVTFVSATEDISTAGATGRLLQAVLASLAQFFSDLLSERMKDSMLHLVQQGKYPGGAAPFGYRTRPGGGGLEPDENATIVAEIFRLYAAEEKSSTQIVHELRARGHSHSKRLVLNVLRNETYLGKYRWQRQSWAAPHSPLVTQELFDRAGARLAQNHGDKGQPQMHPKAAYRYLLDGLVRCGVCGSHMSTSSAKSKSRVIYPYYRCTAQAGDRGCRARIINARMLDEFVAERVAGLALDPKAVAAATARSAKQESSGVRRLQAQLSIHTRELNEAERRVSALMDTASKGLVNEENKTTWNSELARWTAARETCRTRRDAVAEELRSAGTRKKSLVELPDLLREVADHLRTADTEARRSVIRSLLQSVTVGPDSLELAVFQGGDFVNRERMAPPQSQITKSVVFRFATEWRRGVRCALRLRGSICRIPAAVQG